MSIEISREFALPGVAIHFRFSGHTDRGAVRRINEDSYLMSVPLFVIADGMGGHAFGDRASQAAIAAFADALVGDEPAGAAAVLETIKRANESVLAVSAGSDALSGTTLTGVAFVDLDAAGNYHWMAFNVGDSRVYGWDGRTLSQLSVDHSLVQELIDSGSIAKADAERHPQRNVVTRALGAADTVDADIWLLPARGRQRFLLCSDGLSKELSDDEIARIMVFHDAELLRDTDNLPMTLAERLANAAIAAGGSDNVTVVIVESEVIGVGTERPDDDTLDRGALSWRLEDTRPRG